MNMHLQTRQIIAAVLVAAGTLMARPVSTQEAPPVLLLLDLNAIAAEQAPNLFSDVDVNSSIAGIGVRDPLRFFRQNVGQTLVLPGGAAGHEGWFSIGSTPENWASAAGLNDGRQNFLLAGPGLGSPDADENRTSLLAHVAGIAPLGVTNLQSLAGRNVCAVVFKDELTPSSDGTSLEGQNTGVVAFSLLSAATGSDIAVEVSIKILDFAKTCGSALSVQ